MSSPVKPSPAERLLGELTLACCEPTELGAAGEPVATGGGGSASCREDGRLGGAKNPAAAAAAATGIALGGMPSGGVPGCSCCGWCGCGCGC